MVDLTNDSGVEDELVDLTSPVSSSVNMVFDSCYPCSLYVYPSTTSKVTGLGKYKYYTTNNEKP